MMRAMILALLMVMTSTVWPLQVWAKEGLEAQLYRRFQPSLIEIENPSHRGMIVRQGQLLTIAGDAVPAKPFRVIQATPGAPSSHVMDFARVDVRANGTVRAERAPLVIPRGSRVVVLEVRISGDEVHLLTHSAEPLPRPGPGEPVYGCTEFVFQMSSSVLEGGDAEPLFQLIERWLEWNTDTRLCDPYNRQLCLEP